MKVGDTVYHTDNPYGSGVVSEERGYEWVVEWSRGPQNPSLATHRSDTIRKTPPSPPEGYREVEPGWWVPKELLNHQLRPCDPPYPPLLEQIYWCLQESLGWSYYAETSQYSLEFCLTLYGSRNWVLGLKEWHPRLLQRLKDFRVSRVADVEGPPYLDLLHSLPLGKNQYQTALTRLVFSLEIEPLLYLHQEVCRALGVEGHHR
jgi:hypothetical protein